MRNLTYLDSVFLAMGFKPQNVKKVIGSVVNFTCLYESKEKLNIQFFKNYTNNSSIAIDTISDLRTSAQWNGGKVAHVIIDPDLQFVICQILDIHGIVFGTMRAMVAGFVLSIQST